MQNCVASLFAETGNTASFQLPAFLTRLLGSTLVRHFGPVLQIEVSNWSARPEGSDLDDDITMVAFRVK